MKKTTTKILIAFAIMSTFVLIQSCVQTEEVAPQPEEIPQKVLDQFTELGFDVSDIALVPGGNVLEGKSKEMVYLLEGDLRVTAKQLEEMIGSDVLVGPTEEQYRTYNLVSGLPRTINVIGYTGGSYALDSKMRTALQWAINNYNRINTNLTFTLTFGTNYSSYDIVVYKYGTSAGGSAGFPSGGDPHWYVEIGSQTSNNSTNVVEHVMTHELGHCLGLRHTDYFNRAYSCGKGGNEGSGSDGAVHIPGTPYGYDANSIMNACFSSSEDGEFGYYDIEALEYLY